MDGGYRMSLVRPDAYLGDQVITYAVEFLYGWAVKVGPHRRWVHVPDKAAAEKVLYNIGAGETAS